MTITKEFCDNCGKELAGRDSWLPVKIIFYGRRGLDLRIDKEYKLCRTCYSNLKMHIKPEVDEALLKKDKEIENIKEQNERVINNLNKEIENIKRAKVNSVKYNDEMVERAAEILSRNCSRCCNLENFLTGRPGASQHHWYCNKLKTDIPDSPYIFSCASFDKSEKEYEVYSDGSMKEIK